MNSENLKMKEEILKLRARLDEDDTKKITEILNKVLEKKEKIPKEKKCTKKRKKQEEKVEIEDEQFESDKKEVEYDENEEKEILEQKKSFYCNTDGCKKKFNVWGSLVNHIKVWIL